MTGLSKLLERYFNRLYT